MPIECPCGGCHFSDFAYRGGKDCVLCGDNHDGSDQCPPGDHELDHEGHCLHCDYWHDTDPYLDVKEGGE